MKSINLYIETGLPIIDSVEQSCQCTVRSDAKHLIQIILIEMIITPIVIAGEIKAEDLAAMVQRDLELILREAVIDENKEITGNAVLAAIVRLSDMLQLNRRHIWH